MRVVVIGDIGVVDGMIHIGDEAMFETLARELRTRGHAVTGISSAPEESAERYGIAAVERIGFDLRLGREAARERMRAVLDGSLPASDPAHAVVAAVEDADAVVIAGGGNMASTWPTHIYERATLGVLAQRRGIPLVVSGQTLGPELVAEDSALVEALLASARLVGVREGASLALARGMALPDGVLHGTVDDASFLSEHPAARGDFALVSLSTHVGAVDRDRAAEGIAALLDEVARVTGLAVRFHAHWASLDAAEVRGDSVLHETVRQRMTSPSEVVPTRSSAHSAALAREAGMVVTSRYHPAVFAAPAGVPIIGLPVDEYTRVKLTGALGNFGQDAVVPLDAIASGELGTVADVWARREDIARVGADAADRARARSAAWWDRIDGIVRGA